MSLLWLVTLNVGHLSLILGLSTRSTFLRHYLFLPICLVLFIRITFVDAQTGITALDRLRPSAAALSGVLRALELLLCSGDPQKQFVRDRDVQTAGAAYDISEQPLGTRMRWAAALCFSQRGAGWNWRVAGTPPARSPRPTSVFVLQCALRYAANYLVLEALSLVFELLTSPGTLRGPLVLLHGIMVYTSLHTVYEPGCVLWVLAGMGGMEECVPLFGRMRDGWTLRGFWGRTWHQFFRRVCVPFALVVSCRGA